MNGHDDLAGAVELDLITAALPEQRFFIWRLMAALASHRELERLRNDELRHARRFYPGMAVSGRVMTSKTLRWMAGMRKYRSFTHDSGTSQIDPELPYEIGSLNGR